MHAFYAYLSDQHIVELPDVYEELRKWDLKHAVEVYNNCHDLLQKVPLKSFNTPSVFDFSASRSIAAVGDLCMGVPCRMDQAVQLGVFSGLYSDSVTIPNFFPHPIDVGRLAKINRQGFVQAFLGNLAVMVYLKPLLLANIIRINSNTVMFCSKCFARKIVGSGEVVEFCSEMQVEAERILKEHLQYKLKPGGDVSIIDPLLLLGEARSQAHINIPKLVGKRKIPKRLIDKLISDSANNIVNDLALQYMASSTEGTTYLTQRDIDPLLISDIELAPSQLNTTVAAFTGGIMQALPFIENIDPAQLISVREKESSAFEVYRDAINKLLAQVDLTKDAKFVESILRNDIQPHLHKIEQSIKSNRNKLRANAGKKIGISLASVSVGYMLHSKLGVSTETLGAVLGAPLFANAANDIVKSSNVPMKVQENAYYFLWRAKQINESH